MPDTPNSILQLRKLVLANTYRERVGTPQHTADQL